MENYPVLSSAVANGTNLTVAGTLSTGILGTYQLDFYWSPVGNPSGYGEGKTYIGSASVTTNALGTASFNATFSGISVPAGAVISATATDSSGNTSEFAQNVTVTPAPDRGHAGLGDPQPGHRHDHRLERPGRR